VIALCSDPTVTDAPLLLMEHVDGFLIDDPAVAQTLSEDVRGAIGRSLAQTLVAIHAVDLERTGISDLAPNTPYAQRQLKLWSSQWVGSRARELPQIDALALWLQNAIPVQNEVTLVHGDFRLASVITAPDTGEVRAVLDWEYATLGDPLADLGGLLAAWPEAGDRSGTACSASASPGFPTRRQLAEAYAEESGRDLAALGFWHVLGLWKLAIICEGVRRRALDDGRFVAPGAVVDEAVVDALLERALSTASELGL
jgi:aminoglycoside phosphotransferase (APT) family kinase protein